MIGLRIRNNNKMWFNLISPHQNRYARKNSQGGQSSIYSPAPEYDDPANCAEEDQYVSSDFIEFFI